MPTNKRSDAYERGTIQVPGDPKVPLDARSRQSKPDTPEKRQPDEPGPEPPSVAETQGKARATDEDRSAEPRETAGGPTRPEPTDAETVMEAAALDGDPHVQLRMGEALRNQGINEQCVAAAYARVVGMLKNKATGDSVDKVMLDILKECSKHLEEDSKAAGSAPIRVRLIHNVARPQRAAAAPSSSCPDD